MSDMTPQERQQLRQLIRLRERRAKSQADAFAADRLAQFEQEMATIYKADDERWKRISEAVERLTAEANAEIAAICKREGIREAFRPRYHGFFASRGENADKARRIELRKVAETRVKADAKAAKAAIEEASGRVQEQLLIGGLRSEDAKALVEGMPSVEDLMPPLPTAEIIAIEEATGGRNWDRRDLPSLVLPAASVEAEDDAEDEAEDDEAEAEAGDAWLLANGYVDGVRAESAARHLAVAPETPC